MSRHDEHFLNSTSFHPRPTPTIGNNGTWSIVGRTTINAPASAVYDALIDMSSYKTWNSFVLDATTIKSAAGQTDIARMHVGAQINLHVRITEAGRETDSKELCVEVGPLKTGAGETTTVRWVLDNAAAYTPAFLLKAEHVNEIIDMGDGKTEFVHWETFGGLVAGLVKRLTGDWLREKYVAMPEELKKYVEGRQGEA